MSARTVQADRLIMSVEERAEYEEWRDARPPYRDGSAQQRAFIAGMRAQRRVDAAAKINDQCAECLKVDDMRVIGDTGDQIELRCPHCGASTYVPGRRS